MRLLTFIVLLLLTNQGAWAEPAFFDSPHLLALANRVRPLVEAQSGATFTHFPEIRVVPRTELETVLAPCTVELVYSNMDASNTDIIALMTRILAYFTK